MRGYPIDKPNKVFFQKKKIPKKVRKMVDSARVWEDSFLDLGQTNHFQLSVEDDLVRG